MIIHPEIPFIDPKKFYYLSDKKAVYDIVDGYKAYVYLGSSCLLPISDFFEYPVFRSY